jgi:penicillin-binding protein 1C
MSPYMRLQQKVTVQKIRSLVKRFIIILFALLAFFFLLNFLFPLKDNIEYSTVVTDKDGAVVHAFLTKDEKWRMRSQLGEISPLLRKTIVAKEDKYFYSHPGINIIAIFRAAFNNLFHLRRTSGASTITMQVARALESRKRNLGSKLIESFRAIQLELKYSKEEILQIYLNLAPYGGNIEGVKAASLIYFQKDPDHLSLAEITALSIIPNRPSSLVPGRDNDRIITERNKWLHRFAREKIFTAKEIEDALNEPLDAKRRPLSQLIPHLSLKLRKENKTDLLQTTIRSNLQLKIEKLTEDYVRSLRLKNIRNAAVVVVDNRTHEVISYVGSSGFLDTTDGGQVNGAAAVRQPGSTLKPLLYALCMDEGLLTPKVVIDDVPVNYQGYAPENYDRKFNGFVTVEQAVERSLNIPAVKSLEILGKDRLISALISADFKQIKKDRNKLGLSMVLGGCGTTLEELTGLFATLANEGVYSPLIFRKDQPASQKTRLISAASSFLVTEMLSNIQRPDFPLNWQATEHLPKIAWKTGTSYGRKDAWSIGYNKNYTVGVWAGNFSGLGVEELSGSNTATPLLFRIFNTLDYNNDGNWFSPPRDIDIRQVCPVSGLVPGPNCTTTIMDRFIPLISSTAVCNHLKEYKVSADSSISYCETCAPSNGYIKKLYRGLSAGMQDYFNMNNIRFQKIPPHNPACEKVFKGEAPFITSPANGTEYFISKDDIEPITLSAKTTSDVSRLYWYINNKFYKSCHAGEKQFFTPEEGPVKISCTDDKGRNRDVVITVKYVSL